MITGARNARVPLRAVPTRTVGWLALLAAVMTAGLVTYGSWVRVSGSGLGCPDWPLCNGGITPGSSAAAIEFGHRVYAGLTMITVFVAAGLAFLRRADIRIPALLLLAAAALIVLQAIIGGVAVLTELPQFIIMVHLTMAMMILGLLVGAGVRILFRGNDASLIAAHPQAVVLVAAGSIMIGGSIVATQTGPGCLSFPLCEEGSTTMAMWLHMLHRVLGVVLLIGTAALIRTIWRLKSSFVARSLTKVLAVLLIGQMTAGVVAVATTFPESLRILHVGLATLIWASLISLWSLSPAVLRRVSV